MGKIQQADLENHLEAVDRDLIEQNIAASLWYPLDSYERIVQLVRQAEGGVGAEYWIRFGRENAEDVLASSAVQVFLKAARGFGPRAGIALIKLARLFFNFGEWSWEGDSLEKFKIEVSEAQYLSESVRLGALGFMLHLAQLFAGHEVRIVSERPSNDVVIYRTG
jgi:hypothetical protein